MSARTVTALYAALVGGFAAAYFGWPATAPVSWAALGLTGVAGVVWGVRRHRPRQARPWLVLALGLTLLVVGDAAFNLMSVVGGRENPFPSIADAFYLASTVTLATSLVLLGRAGVVGGHRASLLDALTITLGLGLLSWIFLIRPYVDTPELTTVQRLVSVAYPLGDVLILLMIVRMVSVARRGAAVTLLAVGAAALLISDCWYGLNQLRGWWEIGGLADVGWIVAYASWGAAALQPSMAGLTEPRIVRQGDIPRSRLGMLAAASLIAPAVLLTQSLTGGVTDGTVIALLSAALFLLVLARLAGVVGSHRSALARAGAIREFGAALTAAADTGQVLAAIERALPDLGRPGRVPAYRVVLLTADEAATGPPPGGPAGADACWPVDVQSLPVALAERLAGCACVLRCPLVGRDGPAERAVGELLLGGDADALVDLLPAAEVVAAQAALALDRIALSDEVNRRISEEYFRTLVHNSTDVILILCEGNRVRYASPSAATILGRPTVAGVPLLDLIAEPDRPRARTLLGGVLGGELSTEYADWTVLREDGGEVQVEVSCRDLRDDPTVGGLVLTLRDVTERRRLEAELSHRALHDALTGLANRVLFHDRTHRAVQRAHRNGTLAGVLFVDLDDFKVVNDTLGHERGDDLLVAIGRRLREVLREHDTAARLGGDEFAVLVEDATHPADVEQVADRVLAALAVPVELGGAVLSGQASVGVAISTDAGDAQDLLRQADLALYLAKSEGKHQWRRYNTTLHTALLHRLEVRAALERAVADQAFTLHFQPIMDLVGESAVGVEALVRWNHPERGPVLPAEFIEVAESSGLIVPIGTWVLRAATATAAGWRGAAGTGPYVSVNVSARQFRAPGFVEEVRSALANAGLPASALLLEITESLLLREDERVWSDLAALQTIGVRIAIDDFGTGYSSLSYLRQMPIDVVKIDRSFVRSMAASPQQAALVDGIIRLAHTMGLAVVAEGVEEPAQGDLLRDMGCRYAQGYLFARPMPAEDLLPWLAAEKVRA